MFQQQFYCIAYASRMISSSAEHNRTRVASNVRRLRKSKGLSQREFGLMVGVDYSYISHIENGSANVSIDLLSKIADGLDIEVKDLFL